MRLVASIVVAWQQAVAADFASATAPAASAYAAAWSFAEAGQPAAVAAVVVEAAVVVAAAARRVDFAEVAFDHPAGRELVAVVGSDLASVVADFGAESEA